MGIVRVPRGTTWSRTRCAEIRRCDTRPDFRSPAGMPRACLSIAVRCRGRYVSTRPPALPLIFATSPQGSRTFAPRTVDHRPFVPRCFWKRGLLYDSPSTDQFPKTAASMSVSSDWARSMSCRVCLPRPWASLSVRWSFGTPPRSRHPRAAQRRSKNISGARRVLARSLSTLWSMLALPCRRSSSRFRLPVLRWPMPMLSLAPCLPTALPATIWLSPLAMPQPARLFELVRQPVVRPHAELSSSCV